MFVLIAREASFTCSNAGSCFVLASRLVRLTISIEEHSN